MGSPGCLVALVEWDEVLDVGRDERPTSGGCRREDLLIRQSYKRGVFDDRRDIMAAGPELLSDGAAEHLVEKKGGRHVLSGEKVPLAPPHLLSRDLGVVSGVDFGVDFRRIARPVADRSAH